MKKIKLLAALAILGLAFAARAQTPVYSPLNIALVGQVQQPQIIVGTPGGGHISLISATTTNLTINTKSLLKLIAADQGLTLPPKARLWLADDRFVIVNPDNTIFTNVDTELLSITYVTNVVVLKTVYPTNGYVNTLTETLVTSLDYNGSSISFTLNCYGKFHCQDRDNHINEVVARSYSCQGLGSGTCGDRSMVIKGSLSGQCTTQYSPGDEGGHPGTVPHPFPPRPPKPPGIR